MIGVGWDGASGQEIAAARWRGPCHARADAASKPREIETPRRAPARALLRGLRELFERATALADQSRLAASCAASEPALMTSVLMAGHPWQRRYLLAALGLAVALIAMHELLARSSASVSTSEVPVIAP